MNLASYILNDIKPVRSNSKVSDLMVLFNQLTFSHIPIKDDKGVFLGSFSETDVYLTKLLSFMKLVAFWLLKKELMIILLVKLAK